MKQCRELISMLLVMAILTMSLPMTVVAEEMPVAETLPVAELALPESRSGAVVSQGTCGDDSVDNKDLTRLFQYLSDWNVEIY